MTTRPVGEKSTLCGPRDAPRSWNESRRYLGGEGNFLRPIVGVEDVDSDLLGVAKAGTSTALGFVAFQSVQNVTFKAGTAWLDPADEPVAVKEEVPADPQASFS